MHRHRLHFVVVAVVVAAAFAGVGFAVDPDDPLADIADPFAGVFQNDVLTVQLVFERAKDRFSGTLKRGERSFPMTAKRVGESITGHYTAGGKGFPFTATLAGDTLRFAAANSVFELARQKAVVLTTPEPTPSATTVPPPSPAAPDAPAGASPAPSKTAAQPAASTNPRPAGDPLPGESTLPQPPAQVAVVGPKMKPMRHPNGFVYRYPERWRLSTTADNVYLFPDLTQRGEDGTPLEVCMISLRAAAPDIADAADPKLLSFFDELMKVNATYLKRVGAARPVESLLGPGLVATYEGKSPDGGESLADVYGVFDAQRCSYMVHMGRRDMVESHRPMVAQVFSTFGWLDGQPEPALVGVWRRADGSATLELIANGTCAATTPPLPGAADPAATVTRRGTWTVTRDRLYIAWEDGSAELLGFQVSPVGDAKTALDLRVSGADPIRYVK